MRNSSQSRIRKWLSSTETCEGRESKKKKKRKKEKKKKKRKKRNLIRHKLAKFS